MASADHDGADVGEGMDEPDFSHLPDIVWVQVLSYLDLPQRSRVARTCHALNDAFNHPSLWHTVKISLLGNLGYSRSVRTLMPERYTVMIERFGGFFQNLTLKVIGFLDRFPPKCQRVIETLSERCRLESFTLEVGVTLTKFDFYQHVPRKVELDVLVNFIAHAFRLKSFHLKAWPLYRGIEKVDILEALITNPKLKKLERLNLFWLSAEVGSWATLNATLPSPENVLSLVEHFTNLTHIGLRSSMLNEQIVAALSHSHHTPMEKLSVLVTYSVYEYLGGIPAISPSAWKQLRRYHPKLTVEFTMVTRIPSFELAGLLRPEIPVTALEFMKFSQLNPEDLVSITEKYSKSLTKFVSLNASQGLDESLKQLVKRSPHLTYLAFHGNINYKTVIELAGLKGCQWSTFRIQGDVIDYSDGCPLDDIDPDVIVMETAPGQVELVETVRRRWFEEEEGKYEQRMVEMVKTVAQTIGQKWFPVDHRHVEELLAEGDATTDVKPEKVVKRLLEENQREEST